MRDLLLPNYDRWLDAPYQQRCDEEAEEESDEDESRDEDLWPEDEE